MRAVFPTKTFSNMYTIVTVGIPPTLSSVHHVLYPPEVVLQLLISKCIPILYGLEPCPLGKSDLL